MVAQELNNIWNYYLSLEADLARTSQYIEPIGQDEAYSFEFAKILILACTECEAVFKQLCCENLNGKKGDMNQYRQIIRSKFPKIYQAKVEVPRYGQSIQPLKEWAEDKPLPWWQAYNAVKHNRETEYRQASYKNALYAIAGLYVLIFYLAKENGISFKNGASNYIESDYADCTINYGATRRLPDFENEYAHLNNN